MPDTTFWSNLQPEMEHRHGNVYYLPEYQSVILRLQTTYLPYAQFLQFLDFIEQLADQKQVTTMIFDKSSLRIFHQPSMEWYHVVWKEKMYQKGVSTYRKILPADPLFKESVKIGRERLVRENPGFQIEKFDIQYFDSILEIVAELLSIK